MATATCRGRSASRQARDALSRFQRVRPLHCSGPAMIMVQDRSTLWPHCRLKNRVCRRINWHPISYQ